MISCKNCGHPHVIGHCIRLGCECFIAATEPTYGYVMRNAVIVGCDAEKDTVTVRLNGGFPHAVQIGASATLDYDTVATDGRDMMRREIIGHLQRIVEDYEARWDMKDARTNPGIIDSYERAKRALALMEQVNV